MKLKNMAHVLTLALILLAILLSTATLQATETATTFIGSRLAATHNFGGSTTSILGAGNRLYYTEGAALVIADISDPQVPIELGRWSGENKGNLIHIHLDASLLYLTRRYAGTEILDVSNPAEPTLVGNIPILFVGGSATSPLQTVTLDAYAFVLQGSLFRVVDVSDPSTPVNVTHFEPSANFMYTVHLSGDYAYVGDNNGLRTIDISSPETPVVVSSLDIAPIFHIEQRGSLLYVAAWTTVRVIDISTPTAPVEVAVFNPDPFFFVHTLSLFDNYLYLSNGGSEELLVADISTATSPVELTRIPVPPMENSLFATDGALFAATRRNGLAMIDITNPAAPSLLDTIGQLPSAQSIARIGGHTFVASGEDLWLMQTQPAEVTGTKIWSSSHYIGDITGSNNRLYVIKSDNAGGSGFLEILDVTNPTNPVALGSVELTIQGADHVILSGEYAYISSWSGMSVVNVANPNSPVETHYILSGQSVGGLQIQGDYLYAAMTNSLRIYNVSNPAQLTFIGEYAGTQIWDVDVAGDYAFVATFSSNPGLHIVDVSTPSSPSLIRSLNTCSGARRVNVGQDFAYVADGGCRIINMFDVSDPLTGTSFSSGSAAVPGFGSKMVVENRELFVSVDMGGFLKLEHLEYALITLPPEGGDLISPDGTTIVSVPGDAFASSIRLRFDEEPAMPIGNIEKTAEKFFSIEATDTGTGQQRPLLPGKTMTITVQYDDTIIFEETLKLYRWDGSQWTDEGIDTFVDSENNQVIGQITSFSGKETFALLYTLHEILLPLVVK